MENAYKIIVIGGSSGIIPELKTLFSKLPRPFKVPIVVTAHIYASDDGELVRYYHNQRLVPVKEAEDKEPIRSDTVYFAPPDYHLLIQPDATFSLSKDRKVNFARPSIDVLFQSAGFSFGDQVIGILLTGANHDGVEGICDLKRYGALTIVQNPDSAECAVMPQAAIDTGDVDIIATTPQLTDFLVTMVRI